MPNERIFLSDSEFVLSEIETKPTVNDIDEFELLIEKYFEGKRKVTALNSGTSAIHLALILAGVRKDDEVLCQSFTYVATANPIRYLNAHPVFIGSEKETWNMCPVFLEEAIKDRIAKGKKPKVIIFVHLYGIPAKVGEIVAVAKKYDILLIEDAAEALGAEYKGEKCGTFGDFGILSFNTNKIVTTFGGGALLCKTKLEKERSIYYATQAKEKVSHYEHKKVGYNYRMNALAAKIGIQQFKQLEENIKKKKVIHNSYKEFFKSEKCIILFSNQLTNIVSNHWLNCILINGNNEKYNNRDLIKELEKENIEARLLWKPMHLQVVFKNYSYYGNNYSDALLKKGLCLPSGTNLENDDFIKITSTIQKLL